MSSYVYFIGFDTSKKTLSVAVRDAKKVLMEQDINNNVSSIRKFIKELRKLDGFHIGKAVFCMEHTGIYNNYLLKALSQMNASISVVAATHIKLSLGMQRGKNDQVDAKRISEYALRFADKIELWTAPRQIIIELGQLIKVRDRLTKVKVQLSLPIQEVNKFMDKKTWNLIKASCHKTLSAIEVDLKNVESQILKLIDSDDYLRKIFEQVKSVTGVGPKTASEVIIRTNEFKKFKDAKKFACHSGVAPFENQSGTSLKGKARVSHRACKRLKTLFHLCAMAAIRTEGEFKEYYNLKTSQGKNKMSVLNAIRNKLILRIFAVVRNDTTYKKNYNYMLQVP